MNIGYDLSDVFILAKEMERNAAAFYEAAAGATSNSEVEELLAALALEERAHEVIFDRMCRDAGPAAEDGSGQDGVIAHYLRNIAGRTALSQEQGQGEHLSDDASAVDILELGMEAERDSILMYIWLRGAIADPNDLEVVEGLIEEEHGHLSKLKAMSKQLG